MQEFDFFLALKKQLYNNNTKSYVKINWKTEESCNDFVETWNQDHALYMQKNAFYRQQEHKDMKLEYKNCRLILKPRPVSSIYFFVLIRVFCYNLYQIFKLNRFIYWIRKGMWSRWLRAILSMTKSSCFGQLLQDFHVISNS